MTTKEFADSLRLLADWYEQQPDTIPIPDFSTAWYWGNDQKETAIKVAYAFGDCKKEYIGNSLYLKKKFGNLTLAVRFSRDAVCTRHIIGTKKVEEEIFVKTGRMVDQEICEWDCHPLLNNETPDDNN